MKWGRRAISVAGVLLLTAMAMTCADPADRLALGIGSGSPELGSEVLELLGTPRHRVAAAVVRADTTTYAYFGSGNNDEFELGSLTEVFTAQLLRQAIDQGRFKLSDTIGTYLDVGTDPIASVTLQELLQHTSGLAPWGPADAPMESAFNNLAVANPYELSASALMKMARSDQLATRGTVVHSYLNPALLGLLLEVRNGRRWDFLVNDTILRPQQMSRSFVARPQTTNLRRGFDASGRRQAPLVLDAAAPAGGLRSTPNDMVRWIRSVTRAGTRLFDPIPGGPTEQGWGWNILNMNGRRIAWSSTTTPGYAAALGIDTQTGTAVIVLSDTAVPISTDVLQLLDYQ